MRIRSVPPAVALVALTACGGSGGPPAADGPATTGTASTAHTTSAPAAPAEETPPVAIEGKVNDRGTRAATGGTVAMELGDFYFAPTFVKGEPGSVLTVTLTNSGQAPHTFTVDAPAVDVTVAVGGTGAASVTLPTSGTLVFYCRLHRAQGMQGGVYL